MNVPVAVSPAVARYHRGVLDALQESGFLADEPADLFAWAGRAGRSAVILSLSTPDELSTVARLQSRTGIIVVVLLTEPRPRAYREVLAAGGFPVAWDVPPAGIAGVLQAAINGQVLVPQGVATRLAWTTADEATGQAAAELPLDETELHILARIARGHTDRRIATALRVSERTVRRRLRMLFAKLEVETRVQAGIYAAQRGLAGPEAGTLFLVNAAGADGDTARGAGA